MRKIVFAGLIALLAVGAVVRCGDGVTTGAGNDGGAARDAGTADAGQPATDAGVDGGFVLDAGGDAGEAGDGADDAGEDSSVDVGTGLPDGGVDAASDIGGDGDTLDGGVPDAGEDAGGGTTDAGWPADGGGPGPYAQNGAETFHVITADLTNAGRTFTEHIYIPDTAQPHAVVVFGPATQQTTNAYITYYERLASHGFLVLSRDDPGPLVNTKLVVADLEYLVLQWLPAQNADPGSALFGRADLARVGLTGHSRGGKATLLAAEGGLKGHVKGWFGIDLVDVTFIDDGIYAVTNVGSVGIPTTFLTATVASNCSPAANNGQALFAYAPSPSVLLLAMGAGHTQFEDPAGCLLCSVCTPQGTADQVAVEDYTRRYVTAFFARELLGDSSVGPAFEGAGVAADVAAGLVQVQTK